MVDAAQPDEVGRPLPSVQHPELIDANRLKQIQDIIGRIFQAVIAVIIEPEDKFSQRRAVLVFETGEADVPRALHLHPPLVMQPHRQTATGLDISRDAQGNLVRTPF